MSSKTAIFVSSAVLLAAGLGTWAVMTPEKPAPDGTVAAPPSPRRSIGEQLRERSRPRDTMPSSYRASGSRSTRSTGKQSTNLPGALRPPLPPAPVPAAGPSGARNHADLARRAATVEEDANRKLNYWTSKYGLTEAQQDAIFPILARGSSAFDSALAVEGAALAPVDTDQTVEEQIHAALTPEQQAQLEEETVDRNLWWTEIVGLLNDEMIAAENGTLADSTDPPEVTAASEPAATAVSPSETETGTTLPAAHGGSNIFDLLNGAP